MSRFRLFIPLFTLVSVLGFAQTQSGVPSTDGLLRTRSDVRVLPEPDSVPALEAYRLGPDDQIMILGLDMEEISGKPITIDSEGFISIPLGGQVQAAGLTLRELEKALVAGLATYYRNPQLSVTLSEMRSQPVSVIGAVRNAGVHQLRGKRTLVEVLSMAGGLADEASFQINITRRKEWGIIPLSNAVVDETGEYSTAQLQTRGLLEAANPAENILIKPNDVISVPRADLVYVMGAVTRSGGFVLNDRASMSVLQAVAMAGGTIGEAATKDVRLLRAVPGTEQRTEIVLNLKDIERGKQEDVAMRPNDVLFVPVSGVKVAGSRALDVALSTLSGVVIWRGARF